MIMWQNGSQDIENYAQVLEGWKIRGRQKEEGPKRKSVWSLDGHSELGLGRKTLKEIKEEERVGGSSSSCPVAKPAKAPFKRLNFFHLALFVTQILSKNERPQSQRWFATSHCNTASLSHLRTMLPESSSCP